MSVTYPVKVKTDSRRRKRLNDTLVDLVVQPEKQKKNKLSLPTLNLNRKKEHDAVGMSLLDVASG